MQVGSTSIAVVQGDLTMQDTDVVVNAANEELQHGGGVAAALVRAGGIVIQDESTEWVARRGPLGRGTAAITTAGAMLAGHIVHVAGPRYREGRDNAALLSEAVTAALDATAAAGARSVSLPAISAGIFGYPAAEATSVITAAVIAWVRGHPGVLDEVRLVAYGADVADAFGAALAAHG